MGWTETCAMDERKRFVEEVLADEQTMREICERYGVSRKTGYKWLYRYKEEGRAGLEERSRAPLSRPNAADAQTVGRVIELRRAHRSWGPKKLRAVLDTRWPDRSWPATSTIGEILRRADLIAAREREGGSKPVAYDERPIIAPVPNALWTIDFKGTVQTQDRRWCTPLTLQDARSRYLLCCRILQPNEAQVHYWMERSFRRYGLPDAIRSDNGTPFATTGLAGLSRLSVWWLKLGIEIQRNAPGHPEHNPRHERFHRTLKRETAHPPRANAKAQQRAFDVFRRSYNRERPHESLHQHMPASLYEPSTRSYPRSEPEFGYADDMVVRKVRSDGVLVWNRRNVYVSEALRGEWIGLRQIEPAQWPVFLGTLAIATLDACEQKIYPYVEKKYHGRDAI